MKRGERIKLVLLRHGESTWNWKNKFTGWTDVDLDKVGVKEAHNAAKLLKKGKYTFDLCYNSVLKRATHTLRIVLKDMGIEDVPVINSWKLNERHYGALQGLKKVETAKKVGPVLMQKWRRSYDVRPPALKKTDRRYPGNQKKYEGIPKKDLPTTECLKDTVERVMPYWKNEIMKELKKGKHILVSAHGNSLRAIVMHLDKISKKEIPHLNIPTGVPLVYEFDSKLRPVKHYYLGDQAKIQKAIQAVANQSKVIKK